jgi:SAM-dependent methyltransferase
MSMTRFRCSVCGHSECSTFFEVTDMPVLIGVQWPDASSARNCPTGDIALAFCPACGFIWNVVFDPARIGYEQTYDNSLHYSGVFQQYTQQVVDRLVSTYDVRQKRIVDIGCGKGDFLAMLCTRDGNRGFGFDRSFEGERLSTEGTVVEWVNDYYSERYSDVQADLIVSRYVLEHIPDPVEFLKMIRRTIRKPGTVLYFEVPNVDLILRQHSVWDVIYEHCTYFGAESLPRTFARAGFNVLRVAEDYGQQFISVDAQVRDSAEASAAGSWGDLAALQERVRTFKHTIDGKIGTWADQLCAWQREGRSAVAWGAGAKAVSYLNLLKGQTVINRIVDVNPYKRNKYLPGTAQRIISPADLLEDRPAMVVVMNPIYKDEIAQQLADMNLYPELVPA